MAKPHVLIIGGGYVGLYTAWGLTRAARRGEIDVTVVEPSQYMTYKPLLPEVAGGVTEARDVTVVLRQVLRRVSVVAGRLEALDCDERSATVRRINGTEAALSYDHVVLALGAVTHVIPTPGLEDVGIGFSTLEEAVYLRNHILDRVRWAATTNDAQARDKALTFVFVGGGYTGVEAIAWLQDLAARAIELQPQLAGTRPRWVLVEAADAIAVELGDELGRWTQRQLQGRGIEVLLKTTMKSCESGEVVLEGGETIPADTVVWTAGVTPNPALDGTNLPRGPKGHVVANARMQVVRNDGSIVQGAWAAGDNAQVPDLTAEKQPAYCAPNAQNALRQAKLLARNITGALAGTEPEEYRHKSLGTLASYGPGQGAAIVKGIKLRGLAAWIVDKAYHGAAMPTVARKIRLFSEWATGTVLPRNLTSTSAVRQPRRPFREAAEAAEAAAAAKKAKSH